MHTINTPIEGLTNFLYIAMTLLGQQVALIPLLPCPMNLIPLAAGNFPPIGGPRLGNYLGRWGGGSNRSNK